MVVRLMDNSEQVSIDLPEGWIYSYGLTRRSSMNHTFLVSGIYGMMISYKASFIVTNDTHPDER